MEFYQQETIEIDGVWYISVKGTAKAYEKEYRTIHYHINNKSEIFEGYIISGKIEKEKLFQFLTPKQLKAHGKWLDKFANLNIL